MHQMHRSPFAVAVLAALPLCASAGEEKSPFSANVALVSDYAYRGISQTDERPALQGGFDYKHASGFYAGAWGSSISWLRDLEKGTGESSGNSLELDLYGGFTHAFGDFGVDAGLLQYVYPGSFDRGWKAATGLKDPQTLEAYASVSWKLMSFKYSYSFTDLFGAPDSEGSQYFDFSAAYEVADGLTLGAHYGHQAVTGPALSYSDWKIGATLNAAGFGIGLHYADTDLEDKQDFNADARYILSVSRTF